MTAYSGPSAKGALAASAEGSGVARWLEECYGLTASSYFKKLKSMGASLARGSTVGGCRRTGLTKDIFRFAYNVLISPQPVHSPLPDVELVSFRHAVLTEMACRLPKHYERLQHAIFHRLGRHTHLSAPAPLKLGKQELNFEARVRQLVQDINSLTAELGQSQSRELRRPPPILNRTVESVFDQEESVGWVAPGLRRARRKAMSGERYGAVVDAVFKRLEGDLARVCGTRWNIDSSLIGEAIENAISRRICGGVTEGRLLEDKRLVRDVPIGMSYSDSGRGRMPWQGHVASRGGKAPVRLVGTRALSEVADDVGLDEVLASLAVRRQKLALRSLLLGRFPRKPHPEAGTKCNVYLDCLLADLQDYDPVGFAFTVRTLSLLPPRRLFEDQICNSILHGFTCCRGYDAQQMFLICVLGCIEPEAVKSLSDVLKATGNNTNFLWASLVELHCLLGRGVGELDLTEDATRRVREASYWEVPVCSTRLREAVEAVLSDEMGETHVTVESADDHWNKRFEWCVAGSHSHTTNADVCFEQVPLSGPGGKRVTRRMAMEYTQDNPLLRWDGTVKVSVLPKLEQGKVRAIYSCNTASYVAFSRILRPVERCWNGRRVIIDPGAGGNYGMFRRIRTAWPNALPVALMLDYADFNSQHTLESQKLVIACLLRKLSGVSDEEAETLIKSFDNMQLYYKGEYLGVARRSLMSGHRCTSFINSVLNAAYIRMTLGETRYAQLQTFHVGDDVLMFCRTEAEAYEVIDSMKSAGFKLQPTKQSVGRSGFEFLRMAGTRFAAHGYLSRAVASCVSGNWTTEWREDPASALHSLVQMSRTIINRSGNVNAYKLLLRSAHAQTNLNLRMLAEVMSGDVALGAGPAYRSDGRYVYREVLEAAGDADAVLRGVSYRGLPRHGTHAYFTKGCSDIEHLAMKLVGFKPWGAALRSSYGNLADEAVRRDPSLAAYSHRIVGLGALSLYTKSGEVVLDTELDRLVERGRLAHYPIISLLQHVLTDEHCHQLLRQCGITVEPGMERLVAFGGVREGAVVRGWLPYSDAASLGGRAPAATVRVLYPLRM